MAIICVQPWLPWRHLFDAMGADSPSPADAAEPDEAMGEPPSPASGIHVELSMAAQDVDPPVEGWLEQHLTRIAELAGIRQAMISVAIVDDATMTDLHDRYMSQPTTTDVLSFDLRDTPDADLLEGELVICLDEAARQAARRGRDTRLEVLLYAVHGLLHLAGYDDLTPEQSQQMHRREDELLMEAGFGPLFAD